MQFYITLFILFTHINHTRSPHNGSNPARCPVMLMRGKGIGHVTRSRGKLIHFHQHVKTIRADSEGKKGDSLLVMFREILNWKRNLTGLSGEKEVFPPPPSLPPSLPPGLKKIPGVSPSQIGTAGRYVLILFPARWRSHE